MNPFRWWRRVRRAYLRREAQEYLLAWTFSLGDPSVTRAERDAWRAGAMEATRKLEQIGDES